MHIFICTPYVHDQIYFCSTSYYTSFLYVLMPSMPFTCVLSLMTLFVRNSVPNCEVSGGTVSLYPC